MSWYQRYRARHYFGNSLWLLPALATIGGIVAVRLLHWIEVGMDWQSPVHPDAARGVLGTLAASLLTSVVFVCSALLIAVQLVSAQLSPRIISIVFRDPVTKFALTMFAFMFTFSLSALLRVTTSVPSLTVPLAAYGALGCLILFFYLTDHLGKALRPSGAMRVIADRGRKVIASVYPYALAERPEATPYAGHFPDGQPSARITSPSDGVILAFDQAGLLALARNADCVIVMIPQVGDYVSIGDPLFHVFQGGAALRATALVNSVAVGQERTLEQDATLPFRILVDVGLKALSPAINDPTTAVLALDRIHALLHLVGQRQLETGHTCDASGRLRLVYRTPDWEDFVQLAVTEIRHFGGTSIQIARRLRAMLEDLIEVVPAPRAVLLRRELDLLRRSAERAFAEPEDRALAGVRDCQGVGGSPGERQARVPEFDSRETETP